MPVKNSSYNMNTLFFIWSFQCEKSANKRFYFLRILLFSLYSVFSFHYLPNNYNFYLIFKYDENKYIYRNFSGKIECNIKEDMK